MQQNDVLLRTIELIEQQGGVKTEYFSISIDNEKNSFSVDVFDRYNSENNTPEELLTWMMVMIFEDYAIGIEIIDIYNRYYAPDVMTVYQCRQNIITNQLEIFRSIVHAPFDLLRLHDLFIMFLYEKKEFKITFENDTYEFYAIDGRLWLSEYNSAEHPAERRLTKTEEIRGILKEKKLLQPNDGLICGAIELTEPIQNFLRQQGYKSLFSYIDKEPRQPLHPTGETFSLQQFYDAYISSTVRDFDILKNKFYDQYAEIDQTDEENNIVRQSNAMLLYVYLFNQIKPFSEIEKEFHHIIDVYPIKPSQFIELAVSFSENELVFKATEILIEKPAFRKTLIEKMHTHQKGHPLWLKKIEESEEYYQKQRSDLKLWGYDYEVIDHITGLLKERQLLKTRDFQQLFFRKGFYRYAVFILEQYLPGVISISSEPMRLKQWAKFLCSFYAHDIDVEENNSFEKLVRQFRATTPAGNDERDFYYIAHITNRIIGGYFEKELAEHLKEILQPLNYDVRLISEMEWYNQEVKSS